MYYWLSKILSPRCFRLKLLSIFPGRHQLYCWLSSRSCRLCCRLCCLILIGITFFQYILQWWYFRLHILHSWNYFCVIRSQICILHMRYHTLFHTWRKYDMSFLLQCWLEVGYQKFLWWKRGWYHGTFNVVVFGGRLLGCPCISFWLLLALTRLWMRLGSSWEIIFFVWDFLLFWSNF